MKVIWFLFVFMFVMVSSCVQNNSGESSPPDTTSKNKIINNDPVSTSMASITHKNPKSSKPKPQAVKPKTTEKQIPVVKKAKDPLIYPTEKEAKTLYPWPRKYKGYLPLSKRFLPPKGYKRVKVVKGSYEWYIRHLPLRKKGTTVKDYAGNVLLNSSAAASAVIDLDVGKRDLQQCMDTIMRIRGEYYWQKGQSQKVTFRYGGSGYFGWRQWREGKRPVRKGGRTRYLKTRRADYSRKNFRRYLTYMFAMTGTINSTRELKVKKLSDLKAGDYFIHPAKSATIYGHAVIILDIAKNKNNKVKALLGEGYTPAQDFHVVRTTHGKIWYDISPSKPVDTPLWPGFTWSNLQRFKH